MAAPTSSEDIIEAAAMLAAAARSADGTDIIHRESMKARQVRLSAASVVQVLVLPQPRRVVATNRLGLMEAPAPEEQLVGALVERFDIEPYSELSAK